MQSCIVLWPLAMAGPHLKPPAANLGRAGAAVRRLQRQRGGLRWLAG